VFGLEVPGLLVSALTVANHNPVPHQDGLAQRSTRRTSTDVPDAGEDRGTVAWASPSAPASTRVAVG